MTEAPEPPPPIELRPTGLIRAFGDGTWEPGEEGDREAFDALLMPIFDLYSGDLVDVVAWEGHAPELWWLRYKRADFVGEAAIFLANREKHRVKLVTTPSEYLKHWGRAICILNWTADIRAIVGQAEHGVMCAGPKVAARLRGAIDKRPSERLRITTVAA